MERINIGMVRAFRMKFKGAEGIFFDLVALKAMKAGRLQISTEPISFSSLDERPHYTPRKNSSKQYRYVNDVRTNHSCPNICCREIEEKSAARNVGFF